jgi:hypothetical protein
MSAKTASQVARRIFERLREVGDDRAVRVSIVAQKRERIADDHARARILERAGRPLGEIALREFDDVAVDVDHRAALDIAAPKRLT